MSTETFTLQITNEAIEHLKAVTSPRKPSLRISVEGGGCAGFQYKYELTEEIDADDHVIIEPEYQLIIDQISKPLLDGAKIDFVKELGQEYFKIKNPLASSVCGCNNSFNLNM